MLSWRREKEIPYETPKCHPLLSVPQPYEEKVQPEIPVCMKDCKNYIKRCIKSLFFFFNQKQLSSDNLCGNIKVSFSPCFHVFQPHLKRKMRPLFYKQVQDDNLCAYSCWRIVYGVPWPHFLVHVTNGLLNQNIEWLNLMAPNMDGDSPITSFVTFIPWPFLLDHCFILILGAIWQVYFFGWFDLNLFKHMFEWFRPLGKLYVNLSLNQL